jgi:dimethylargininase
MLRDESDRLNRVVVCTPRKEYALGANDFKTHNIGELGDPEIAIQQHNALKATLKEFGAEVIDIPELENHPNSVFTRDAALSTPMGYVKLRLGIESRRAESEWMEDALETIGEECIGEIIAPGTVEGGDVVLSGDVAFIGQSIRTNQEGIKQLSEILATMGYEIRVIVLPDTILHLDKVLMVLGSRQLLYCNELVTENEIADFKGISIFCEGNTTANIICLGDQELIINRSNAEVIERLENQGYIVHILDFGEFAIGMGGPNCLIMPVSRGSNDKISHRASPRKG